MNTRQMWALLNSINEHLVELSLNVEGTSSVEIVKAYEKLSEGAHDLEIALTKEDERVH